MANQRLNVIFSADQRALVRALGDVKATAGRAVAAVGAMGVAAAGFSVKRAMEFGRGIADVNTIARLGGAELQAFRDDIKKLSVELGQDKAPLLDAIYQALSGGIPTDSVIEFTRVAGQLAAVGKGDMPSAVEALIRLRKAFPTASDATLASVAFKTVERGVLNISDLGQNLGRVAGFAATTGASVENLAAELATLTGSFKPEEAITGLNALYSAIVSATPVSALGMELRKAGFESGEAGIRAVGLGGVLGKLTDQTGGSATAMSRLFTEIRAMKAAVALTGTGAQTLAGNMKYLNEATTGVGTAFDRWKADNDAFRMQQLRQEVDSLAITAGTALLPVVNELTASLSQIAANPRNVREFTEALLALADAIRLVVGWIPKLYKFGRAATESDLYNAAEAIRGKTLRGAEKALDVVGAGGLARGALGLAGEMTSAQKNELESPITAEQLAELRAIRESLQTRLPPAQGAR